MGLEAFQILEKPSENNLKRSRRSGHWENCTLDKATCPRARGDRATRTTINRRYREVAVDLLMLRVMKSCFLRAA